MTEEATADLVVYHSRTRMYAWIAFASLFVLPAPLVLVDAYHSKPADAIVAVCFALFMAVFGGSGIRWAIHSLRRPALAIDAGGVTDWTGLTSAGFVPWSEISGVSRLRVHIHDAVRLQLRDPDAYIRRQPLVRRFSLATNRMCDMHPITILTTGTGVNVEEVVRLIERHLYGERGCPEPLPPDALEFHIGEHR